MKSIATLAAVLMLTVVGGCTDPDHYPISGQECGPNDPVLDVAVADCAPAV
ncbi:hypothetical protein OO012_04690 [Rhodobacteraceae bacterium KMM 6894]|nr:hypothetical protein [Rhodobacteraceae bacterium KMM 6894]